MEQHSSREVGFTLLELVVVVLIVIILLLVVWFMSQQ